MTISSQNRKAGPYVGNGTTATFPFTFKVFQASDLYIVRLNTATTIETPLVLASDYTVSLNSNQDVSPGGNVTLMAGALPSGFTLTITSAVAPLQATDLTNQGGFYPSVVTKALDKLTILVQQLIEKVSRSLTLPLSLPSDVSTALPLPEANKVLGWNGTAKSIVNVDANQLATSIVGSNRIVDRIVANGTVGPYTLSADPLQINNTDVHIAGVYQQKDQYSLSGSFITFNVAVPTGALIEVAQNVAFTYPVAYLPAKAAVTNLTTDGYNLGYRNRVINGDMRIDQRNNGSLVTTFGYVCDRWGFTGTQAGKITAQRVSDAPVGFSNSLKLTVSTSFTPAPSDTFAAFHWIEGLNLSDFAWGTVFAKSATLSFWVKASTHGIYSVVLRNSAVNRGLVTDFTATSTWTKISVPVAGDIQGAWLTTNGPGVGIFFGLGQGATAPAPSAVWQSTGATQSSSSTQFVALGVGATLQITGVQFESGTTATSFELLDYSEQLRRCQRYYEVVAGTVATTHPICFPQRYKATKRASPTLVLVSGSVAGANYDVGLDSLNGFLLPSTVTASANSDFTIAASCEL